MADLISAEDLREMRQAQNDALPSYVRVIEMVEVPGNRGTVTRRAQYVDGTDTSPWRCRISPTGFAEERIYADRLGDKEAYVLYVSYDHKDKIKDSHTVQFRHSTSEAWSAKYDVLDIITAQSWQTVTKVLVASVD